MKKKIKNKIKQKLRPIHKGKTNGHKNFFKNHKTNFTEKGGMLSQTFIHRGLCKYDVGSELYRKVGNNMLLFLLGSSTESFNVIFYSKLYFPLHEVGVSHCWRWL